MFKNIKIRTKLFVIFALLSVVAVLTISYVGAHIVKKLMIENKITMLEHIADLKVDKIESFFNERSSDIRVVQDYFNIKYNLPIITMLANDRTNPAYITAKKMLDGQIKNFPNVHGCYEDFMLVSPEGNVVYSANELHEEVELDVNLKGIVGKKAFEQGKKGVFFSDIYASEFDNYVYGMLITAPINGLSSQFIGVVAFELNMGPIYKFIQDTTGLGTTGETLIGKKVEDGALFLNLLRHDKEAALNRKAYFGKKSGFPILEAVLGKQGSGLSTDYRGREIIAVWRHIPSFNWGLVAKIDLSEALAPLSKLKMIIFYIACFTTVLAMAGAFWLSISITEPVKKLSATVFNISRGDLDQRVDVKSRDEIGQLANSFNMMTGNLRTSRNELINAKNYTDNIIKSMTDSLIVINPDTTIRTANQAALNLLGYKEYELIGKPINTILSEKEPHKGREIEFIVKNEFIHNVEKVFVSKTGAKIPVLFSSSAMHDDNGMVQAVVCVAQDITESKRFEEERQELQLKMMQSSKLASLGEVATGIAHEINQPLTYINSFVFRLKENIENNKMDKDKLMSQLNTSGSQIERIVKIVDHLRTFGRRDDMYKSSVSIETIFSNTLLLMREKIRLRCVELIKHIEPDLPMVYGSPTQLEQVFINLFQNAMDAFPANPKNAEINVKIESSKEKGSVIIEVIDNGAGIEKDVIDKVFEPFFTTKEAGKGTGLGLSIVYGIIGEHGGEIYCKSEVNKGTTFTIILPVANGHVKK